MKKLCIFILLFTIQLNFSNASVFANSKFARVENSTNIYSSQVSKEIICLAEKSYFVQILNEYEDTYKVSYNGISGYVKKNDVREITSTPLTPYPKNISIIIGSDCNLRSSPTTKSQKNNIISTLKAGETNIEFIGRIYSDEAIDFCGTTWYYVKYLGEYGYVYNKYIKSITPIYENTEKISYTQASNTNIQNPITNIPSMLIIIILSIPLLFILIILYLPKGKIKKQRHKKQVKIIDKY